MGDAADNNSEAEDSKMGDSMEEKILQLQNDNIEKPLIFIKNANKTPIYNKSHATKVLKEYEYKNGQKNFLVRYTRPLSGNPVDISLPYYQQFCNEIRRADGVIINARSVSAARRAMGHTIDPRKKLLNGPNKGRKKHLNEHFKNASGYINEVKASGNMNGIVGRNVKMFRTGAKTEIARRQVVLKRLKIMETELDKDVTNEIIEKSASF